jgi:mono/diheme cytochrome c family protein
MRKLLILGTLILASSFLSALTISAGPVPPGKKNAEWIARGHKLFTQYCASCHGLDGKGSGPAAAALKTPPADLTAIQKQGGTFPEDHVRTVIDGERDLPAHGTREMPVWGRVLRRTRGDLAQADVVALTRYIQSIQKPS